MWVATLNRPKWRIEAWIKWLTCWKSYFQMSFYRIKTIVFYRLKRHWSRLCSYNIQIYNKPRVLKVAAWRQAVEDLFHKWPVTRKMFPFDDVIMIWEDLCLDWFYTNDDKVGIMTSLDFQLTWHGPSYPSADCPQDNVPGWKKIMQ